MSEQIAFENVTLDILQDFARALTANLRAGDVVFLNGDLGVGKSSFTRVCLAFLSNQSDLEVPSPTFTLIQTYDSPEFVVPVLHVDLYRIRDERELEDLGIEEIVPSHISFVEWPKFDEYFWGNSILQIDMTIDTDGKRRWVFQPKGSWLHRLPRLLEVKQQLELWGYDKFRRTPLAGDASSRRYELLEIHGSKLEPRHHKKHENGTVLVLMDAPPNMNLDTQIENCVTPYGKLAKLANDQTAFVAVSKALNFRGFSAPKVFIFNIEKGILILEYLGTNAIIDAQRTPIFQRYIASAEALALLHGQGFTGALPYKGGIYQLPAYDLQVMMAEVRLFLEWGVQDILGFMVSDAQNTQFHEIWQRTLSRLSQLRETLVLRDFHSPNIIWCEDRSMPKKIGLIDFQDALHGAYAYDLVSLGQDARVDVSQELEHALIQAYSKVRFSQENSFHMVHFLEDYAVLGAQRATKILGIFSRLQIRDNKPNYKVHQPRVWRYLKRNLEHGSLIEFKNWLHVTGIYNAFELRFTV